MKTQLPRQLEAISVDFSELSLPSRDIASFMGYGDHEPGGDIPGIIEDLKQSLARVCRPSFGYLSVEGHLLDSSSILLSGKKISPGRIITRCLRKSTSFIIFVATAGAEYDTWKNSPEIKDDILLQFIADSLGSTIAEEVSALGQRYLEQAAQSLGWGISNSYSPGYCEWNVAEQQILFSLLPSGFCGISLTDSSLMLPVKSVSSLIGVGTDVKKQPYGCAICAKKDCYKRRTPQTLKPAHPL